MEREQALPLVLFIILAGSLLPSFGSFIAAKAEEKEEVVRTYSSSSLLMNITKTFGLNVVGFSSLSDVRSFIENIPGVEAVSAKPPLFNQNQEIPATYIQNLTVILEAGADAGYVAFKIDRLSEPFPKYEKFPENPIVVLLGEGLPLGNFTGQIQGVGINQTFNGTTTKFELMLLPETKEGGIIYVEATFLAYNKTILRGTGYENQRFFFPPIETFDSLINANFSFLESYRIRGLVLGEKRSFDESVLNGTNYTYEPSLSLRVAGDLNTSGIFSIPGIEMKKEENYTVVKVKDNASLDNLTAILDQNSVGYSLEPSSIEILSFLREYPDFIYNVTVEREAVISLPASVTYSNKTYGFGVTSTRSFLPENASQNLNVFNASFLAEYDVVLDVLSITLQEQ